VPDVGEETLDHSDQTAQPAKRLANGGQLTLNFHCSMFALGVTFMTNGLGETT
jgi:hypothetical protein